MSLLHFEDFAIGRTESYGAYRVTREEIVAYARQFDPQPMHLDEEAAKRSLLGGLAASGWHNCAILARLLNDGFIKDTAIMGAPGIDEMKWLVPVRPNDVLTLR